MAKVAFDSGNLYHTISIEQLSGSTPDGYGNVFKSWTTFLSNVPCQILPSSSREYFGGEQVKTTSTHRVLMRYVSGLNTSMRLVYGSRVFTINGIKNLEERNISLEVLVTEEVN